MNFSDFAAFDGALLRVLDDLGWRAPTPIQAQLIPPAMQGRDVWATAPTGSGKTLAFALPLVAQLAQSRARGPGRRAVRGLVLVPTRELAEQVGDVLSALGQPLDVRVSVVFGGVSINPQMMGLRGGADVVVATPGRLLDLLDHNALRLGQVQHLVLDEADRLLDAGFADEVSELLDLLPDVHQTVMVSATFAPRLRAQTHSWMRDPVVIECTEAVAAVDMSAIAQRAIAVDTDKRTPLLRHLLAQELWPRVLVFVATRYASEHVADKLYRNGIDATSLHGDMSQGARREALAMFKAARWRVLVTTDVAARGIDVPGLEAVVNYDLPRSAADYVHRIGRSGRAGAKGVAVSLVTPAQAAHWRLIDKRNGLNLAPETLAGFAPTEAEPVNAHDPLNTGGIKGKRPSKKDKLRAAAAAAAAEQQRKGQPD